MIKIKKSNIHGKGVFATDNIPVGTELICDVLLIDKNNNILVPYQYPWDKYYYSICIGFGSFFNHSYKPNVKIFKCDKINKTKTFKVISSIEKDEELFIKYSKINW